jgi:hypothetical protein
MIFPSLITATAIPGTLKAFLAFSAMLSIAEEFRGCVRASIEKTIAAANRIFLMAGR